MVWQSVWNLCFHPEYFRACIISGLQKANALASRKLHYIGALFQLSFEMQNHLLYPEMLSHVFLHHSKEMNGRYIVYGSLPGWADYMLFLSKCTIRLLACWTAMVTNPIDTFCVDQTKTCGEERKTYVVYRGHGCILWNKTAYDPKKISNENLCHFLHWTDLSFSVTAD